MRVLFFDTHQYDRTAFVAANSQFGHELVFLESRLNSATLGLLQEHCCVCVFVNDRLDRAVLQALREKKIGLVALRCAGFNNVDLKAAAELAIRVVRVPDYSPHAVAEHALALILALNRKIHRAYMRVRDGNFSLEGLVGFDLAGKTAGIIGTGKIGATFAKILLGLGMRVLAYDIRTDNALAQAGVHYCDLNILLGEADIISLHCPLTKETRHMIDDRALSLTKPGVMLINTGRGALVNTKALIRALKSGHLGGAGLDVYEEEEGVFFADHSGEILQDDHLARLMTFPNVLITSHQAFLTHEALANIAQTTLKSIADYEKDRTLTCEIQFTE